MAVQPIRLFGDPVLRMPAQPAVDFDKELRTLVKDLTETMLDASVPVVSVCAVRTGSGKSQTTRAIAQTLRDAGRRVVAVRHPMPYGNLEAQRVQRFASLEDLDRYDTTIEEREEYEPHVTSGTVIYAGVDYAAILAAAVSRPAGGPGCPTATADRRSRRRGPDPC